MECAGAQSPGDCATRSRHPQQHEGRADEKGSVCPRRRKGVGKSAAIARLCLFLNARDRL